ncbi:holin-associated N-acetylmuramidase [Ruegeria sp.]|uniref:holin-associated N-acetylmuramidase n=1 Tax=Ruegeria sp. TaxID=1879320 RepID=UPI003C79D620
MQTVRQIAMGIVAREGGYVDDPDDPGGPTKFGVTLHAMRRLGMDLTEDGSITRADVRALNKEQAVEVFLRYYFEAPRVAMLPEALQASVFDMYVNAGSQAVKILQRLLREMGFDIAVDGAIGPETAAVALSAASPDPVVLRDAYGVARRNYYFTLAERRPPLRKYARTRAGGKGGWIRRAEEFLSPRYHLSQAAFARRVSTWA